MLSEVLLVLSGHESSLFLPGPSTSNATTLITSPHLAEYLHPGEITSLNALADLAYKYKRVKSWSARIQKEGKEAILSETLSNSRKGKGKGKERIDPITSTTPATPNQYLTTLAGSILSILKEYEILIVEVEAKILSLDPALVQDDQGYVPLSALVATFDQWKIPLGSLSTLVDEISGSVEVIEPGKLIDLVEEKRKTGNSRLHEIYTKIYKSLTDLFLVHLITFILYGSTSSTETPSSRSALTQSIGLDVGPDASSPKYRIYRLDDRLIPSSIDKWTRESVLYIGRVSATLKRQNKSLPATLIGSIREEVSSVRGLDELNGFNDAIAKARGGVGEWLWKHILTGSQIIEAIESLSDYFLTRKSDLSLSLLQEIHKLRLDKLVLSNPNSSSSVIREQDLDLALLRASVGTSAENDKFLDSLKFKMEKGPLRAIPTQANAPRSHLSHDDRDQGQEQSHIHKLFSPAVLGTPINLTISISWPLDLFLSPKSTGIYSDIHSYLFALRDTQLRLSNSWVSLTSSHKQIRTSHPFQSVSGDDEIKRLERWCWGLYRIMNWFISELLGHFMDIIDIQHTHLLKKLKLSVTNETTSHGLSGSISRSSLRGSTTATSLGRSANANTTKALDHTPATPRSPLSESHTWKERTARSNRAPPTPNKNERNYLDFLTLRSIHSQHLSFLLEALLLSDPSISSLIRDILETCKSFTALTERWNGALVPISVAEQEQEQDQLLERIDQIHEMDEKLHDQIIEFFSILVDSQNPPAPSEAEGNRSSMDASKSHNFSRTAKINQISKIMNSRQISRNLTGGAGGPEGGGGFSMSMSMSMSVNAAAERHIEQLLLRLDFNGILTKWREHDLYGDGDEHDTGLKSVLARGGLQ
ncbi:uncharacterized protein I303_108606 [Kwoniella dejecticola CBS 10117]|uniref:Spindle pole body component n=1 Tax=Kwoniella dejecticola CBS 10117 TaxID=1296121 RepID=A0AAJ8KX13_9TREE